MYNFASTYSRDSPKITFLLFMAISVSHPVPPTGPMILAQGVEEERKVHQLTATRVLRLHCHVMHGSFPINITWMHNGRPLASYSRIMVDRELLKIQPTTPSDSGFVQCLTANHAGAALATTELRISLAGQCPSWPILLSCVLTLCSTSQMTHRRHQLG